MIAESGLNDPKVVRPPERGGWGCDAVWADDFHHALRVALTGETDGWYEEFADLGTLVKAFHRPHVHDGTFSTFRGRRFGAPADDVAPEHFVVFSSDHDQVGNRAFGDRPPPEARPLAALLTCLAPFTPMLFQGEEYGEHAPFLFFSDHIDPDIAAATREGRRREFAAFAEFGRELPDPQDPATFAALQAHARRRAGRSARALRGRAGAAGRAGGRGGAGGARRPPPHRPPRAVPGAGELRRRAVAARRRAAAGRRRACATARSPRSRGRCVR